MRENGKMPVTGNVSEEIARTLSAEVAWMPEDSPLPSEKELGARFSASRAAVREAIFLLKARGLIRSEKGRGHFVLRPDLRQDDGQPVERLETPRDISEVLQLVELRLALETQAAELAARRRSAEDLDAMERALGDMAEALENEEVDAGVRADFAFHRAIFQATGNPYYLKMLEFVNGPLSGTIRIARENSAQWTAQRWRAQREHQEIYEAIRAGNSRKARSAAKNHVENTAGRLSSKLRKRDAND